MPRMLLTLLAMLLSLQSAWAAVSSYCMHEGDKAPWHFGHHSHAHTGPLSLEGEGSDDGQLAADFDCTQCHMGHCHLVGVTADDDFKPDVGGATLSAASPRLDLAALPERPERPKWAPLA